MDRLISLTIRQVQKRYKDATTKPSEIILESLNRAEKIKPLNAFITLTSSKATETAKNCDKDVKTKLRKPLLGIPVVVKDNFCTDGVRTTCASKMLENFVPTYDATVVSKLKDAGAVLIGKSNLDQFAMGSGTVDSVFGATKNIWGSEFDGHRKESDEWRIAGGSSGGSAVAVASGSCMAAIGSDTGGSTRNPAALCGLVGLKPTYGTVSRHGLIPLVNSLDVPGILARNVDDCLALYNCIAGPDDLDSTTIKEEFKHIDIPDNSAQISLKSIRIGIPQEYHCKNMSPEVLDTWMMVAELLENEGARAKQVTMPYTNASIAVYHILNQCEVASNMARYDGLEYGLRPMDCKSTNELYATARVRGFNEVVRNRILAGNYFLLTKNYEKYFVKAMKIRRLISDDFKKVFNPESSDSVDILLTPTTIGDAPTYGEFMKKNNRDQCALHDYCTQPANMAGVPALSIPIKLSKNNLPLSLQIMGPNLSERTLFLVAKKIEGLVNFPMIKLNM